MFNKFDYKLNLLNIVITNLDMEYYCIIICAAVIHQKTIVKTSNYL